MNYSKDLGPCDSVKLGLILNFSVFEYEVMQNHTKAIDMGEAALKEAQLEIKNVDDVIFMDVKSIIASFKENLSLWKEE